MDAAFPYPLASTDWLAANLNAGGLRVVDASWRMPGNPPARHDHLQRRIPGAVFFDLDEIADCATDLPHMLPEPEAFAAEVGALGIAAQDRVIVYDDIGVFSAARVWWTFRAMGHDDVSVLDGGLPKWLREGRPADTGEAQPSPVDYSIKSSRALGRSHNDVRRAIEGRSPVILDARPAARFAGEAPEPRPGLRRGHMPGAKSLPHSTLLSADGTMSPVEDLNRFFFARGVGPETPVIATCGSGVTAAVIALALERIGHRRHGLYDGAWTEWGREENDPQVFEVVTGADV